MTPRLANMFAKPILGQTLDALLKSVLFLVLGFVALYKLKVSQSVNDLIDKGVGIILRR